MASRYFCCLASTTPRLAKAAASLEFPCVMERHAMAASSSFPCCSRASASADVEDWEFPCEEKRSSMITSLRILFSIFGVRHMELHPIFSSRFDAYTSRIAKSLQNAEGKPQEKTRPRAHMFCAYGAGSALECSS